MSEDRRVKLSGRTVFLHWLVGLMIICLLCVGVYMEETETMALYPWHKSFGMLVVVFALLRIVWRVKNGWPTPVSQYSRLEQSLSRIVHWLLIVATLLMPLSGMVMSSMAGHGLYFFGIEFMANNPNPADPQEMMAINGTLAKGAHTLHNYAAELLMIAVVLHIAGALKHHIMDKDGTLRRMLGAQVD